MLKKDSKKIILVVDDDESITEVVQIVLQNEGFEVLTDINGDYFENNLKALPDLILLDVSLAGKDGIKICRQLKANSTTSKIPIVLMSASTPVDMEKAAAESGANGYINKPFDIEQLALMAKSYLG